MPEAGTPHTANLSSQYLIYILPFGFELFIITKSLHRLTSVSECCMQGWQHFRQVVLRMWSPTCQQWPVVSQESGRAQDLATWEPGTGHQLHGHQGDSSHIGDILADTTRIVTSLTPGGRHVTCDPQCRGLQ